MELDEKLPIRSGEGWFAMARSRSTLAKLAEISISQFPTSESSLEADWAMTLRHQAVSEVYRDSSAIGTEAGLDSLRARGDFQILMMDLRFPLHPFAD